MEMYERVATLIKNAGNSYALTGAGISTESSIPDFRSPGTGLWEKIDPMKTATADILRDDPVYFYKANFKRFASMSGYEPNKAHYALAKLEEMGYLKGVITQNIDGLHIRAGSRKVWEVHGHTRTCSCQRCKKKYPLAEAKNQMDRHLLPPRCPACEGVLRPDVVLFGDPMSEDFFDAEHVLMKQCSLLLVLGSSLTVYPAASLTTHAEKLVIINLQPTDYDIRAEAVIRESCSEALHKIICCL